MTQRPGQGLRRHSMLSRDQAAVLLTQHESAAAKGEVVESGAFRRDYEALVGHQVAASTVYRLLSQAGWRKIKPRTSHPKKDPAFRAA